MPFTEEVQWAAAPTGLQVDIMNACNVKVNALYLSALAFSKNHSDYLGWFGVSSGGMPCQVECGHAAGRGCLQLSCTRRVVCSGKAFTESHYGSVEALCRMKPFQALSVFRGPSKGGTPDRQRARSSRQCFDDFCSGKAHLKAGSILLKWYVSHSMCVRFV